MVVSWQRAERKSCKRPTDCGAFLEGELQIDIVGGASMGRATFESGATRSESQSTAFGYSRIRTYAKSFPQLRFQATRRANIDDAIAILWTKRATIRCVR